ncbi:hypothetical protein DM02DRAFT_130821 [Periconia macrospinosa]|uniref:Uncharacterized protein n=1 Tax=Periconia macrospinosa TaxID=97972 RepID=A0A2V1DDM6_9PLEO|nr:hypothetical protein DM02DRAFT_130821 [Periconia macrospinosa]
MLSCFNLLFTHRRRQSPNQTVTDNSASITNTAGKPHRFLGLAQVLGCLLTLFPLQLNFLSADYHAETQCRYERNAMKRESRKK